jgi:signal transduction histidine kinase
MVVVLVARVASYRLNRGRAPGRRRDVVFLVPWLASSAVFSAFCTAIAFHEPGRWESVAMNAAAGLGGLAAIMQFAAYGRAVLAYALVLTGPPAVAAFVASGLHGGAGLMLGFMWLVFLVLVLPSLRDQHRDFWTSLVAGAVLEQRAERLAITAAERTAFFAAVSHDVRTPMNGILGMARELLARSHDDEQRRALSSIVAASEGLLDTLNDVLDAAKLEAGRLTLDERHFSPRRVIDEVITLASATARQHQVRLEQRVDASVPDAACGDDRRLRQVLANLVANAVRFTSKGTVTVRARAAREGDEVRLFVDVEDTGRGFSPEERERLFVRFAQLDDRAGGTGLGLSNVRDLVGLMGGAVEAHSDGVGKGAVFHFHVALKAADLVPVFDAPGPRVLLAEDDALSARVAAAQLIGQPLCCGDGMSDRP